MNRLDALADLIKAARAAGADAADALLVASTSLSVDRRLGAIEKLERSESVDLGLRVFIGKRQAIVASTEPDPKGFAALAERAVAMARVVPEDPFVGLQDAVAIPTRALDLEDATEPTAEALLARAALAEEAALAVKGKGEAISVFEVIWQASEDLTMAITMQTNMPSISMIIPRSLRLERGEFALVLDLEHPGVVLGRDPRCAIVVADRKASRQHARIERRRDKFFLIDQSTNGTFVTFDGEPEIVLLREEVMLRSRGRISFGHSSLEGEETVRFSMVR
jgi:PmbA protein